MLLSVSSSPLANAYFVNRDASFGHSDCLIDHLPDSDDGNRQDHGALHLSAFALVMASLLAACHILHLFLVPPLTVLQCYLHTRFG